MLYVVNVKKREMKKEKKLPVRKDIAVNIPNAKLEKKNKLPFNLKPITYIQETTTFIPHPDKFADPLEHLHEMMARTPAFFTPEERANEDIRQLRILARSLLSCPFSAGMAYRRFGTAKFPKKVTIECQICGQNLQYIVDFFTHLILDHGSSLQNTEQIFQKMLDKIQYL